jgi:hypothetical protein
VTAADDEARVPAAAQELDERRRGERRLRRLHREPEEARLELGHGTRRRLDVGEAAEGHARRGEPSSARGPRQGRERVILHVRNDEPREHGIHRDPPDSSPAAPSIARRAAC